MKWLVLVFLSASLGCTNEEGPTNPTDTAPEIDTAFDGACRDDNECVDGFACTLDRCVAGQCRWTIADGQCFVRGVCAFAGPRADTPCQRCDPETPSEWTEVSGACDDGDACTEADRCEAGVCIGDPKVCDDQDLCTRDRCDSVSGCLAEVVTGRACDDGDRCTLDDRCGSTCMGRKDPCDDGNDCTIDACDAVTGCTHSPRAGSCEPTDRCQIGQCVEGECVATVARECDDGNSCTVDYCQPEAGCLALPIVSPCCAGVQSACDDQNPCTDDSCDPATLACINVPNVAPCEDGDGCTEGDRCAAGLCVSGEDKVCDDLNPCTTERCRAGVCEVVAFTAAGGGAVSCDDGLACSVGDRCVDGACRGDTSACVCTPSLGPDAVRVLTLSIGGGGLPGEGLDVDEDSATCAPAGQCSGGVDNALSILAPFANGPIGEALGAGSFFVVVALRPNGPLGTGSTSVSLSLHTAERADCATCFVADPGTFDADTCEPLASLTASAVGLGISGGGRLSRLVLDVPIDTGVLSLPVRGLRLSASFTLVDGQVATMAGVLGGAIRKADLLAALAAVPDSALPVDKAAMLSLLEGLVVEDVDLDDDGRADAASIGFRFTAADATLTPPP